MSKRSVETSAAGEYPRFVSGQLLGSDSVPVITVNPAATVVDDGESGSESDSM